MSHQWILGPSEREGHLWWRKTKRMGKKTYQSKYGTEYKHTVHLRGHPTRYARSRRTSDRTSNHSQKVKWTAPWNRSRIDYQLVDKNTNNYEPLYYKSLYWYLVLVGLTNMERLYDRIIHYDYIIDNIDHLMLTPYLRFLNKTSKYSSSNIVKILNCDHGCISVMVKYFKIPTTFCALTLFFGELGASLGWNDYNSDKHLDNIDLKKVHDGRSFVLHIQPKFSQYPHIEAQILTDIIDKPNKIDILRDNIKKYGHKIGAPDTHLQEIQSLIQHSNPSILLKYVQIIHDIHASALQEFEEIVCATNSNIVLDWIASQYSADSQYLQNPN